MRIEVAVVADDEPQSCERLHFLLESIPEIREIRDCRDATETVVALREGGVDLVFFDVGIGDLDGLAVLDDVARQHGLPPTVFVTENDRYASAAFDRDAVDFLLKPFDDARFYKAFSRARRRIEGDVLRRMLDEIESVHKMVLKCREAPTHVIVEKCGRMEIVPTAHIEWIESEGNYVRLHVGHSSYLVRGTLASIREYLKSDRFLQIHRTYIVSVESVREIQRLFHGQYRVLLRDGTELPVSRRFGRRLPILR